MGAESRFNYSAVGDAVNVSARIEGCCKEVGFDILVSETTAAALPHFALLDAGSLGLKGKSTRTRLYATLGDETVGLSATFALLETAHQALVEAFATRSTESRQLLAKVRQRAQPYPATLPEFYRRLARRADHFRETPAADPRPLSEQAS
jgi:adenylate cyclase